MNQTYFEWYEIDVNVVPNVLINQCCSEYFNIVEGLWIAEKRFIADL